MKILGIDSSGLTASAAVVTEEALIAECTVSNGKTHSQTLLPMIDQVMQMSGIAPEELDAIAVAAGPGSFTGLRIGSSTAKGMAQALAIPIVSVPTLEGLAYRLPVSSALVCPLMDARRNQVYTAIYRMRRNARPLCVSEQAAVDVMELVKHVNALAEPVCFLGDGVPVYREALEKNVTVPFSFAPFHCSRQSAAVVAALGIFYMQEGKGEQAAEHRPVYLRQSQAERERAERERNEK